MTRAWIERERPNLLHEIPTALACSQPHGLLGQRPSLCGKLHHGMMPARSSAATTRNLQRSLAFSMQPLTSTLIRLQCALPCILLCSAWMLPVHHSPWLAFRSELCAALALAICVAHRLRAASGRVQISPTSAVVWGLACIPWIQYATGLIYFQGDALMASIYLAGLGLAVDVGRFGETRGALYAPRLAGYVTATGILATMIALAQSLQIEASWIVALPAHGRAVAHLAQPNLLATLLVVTWIAALSLHQWRRLSFAWLCAVGLTLTIGMVLTDSRIGQLEVYALFSFLLLIRKRASLSLSIWQLLMLLGGFASVVHLIAPLLESLTALPLGRSAGIGNATIASRLLHWQTLADAITRSPWWGYGWNQVSVAQANTVLNHAGTGEMIEHSHNLLLDLLVWLGIPLGLACTACLVWWLRLQLQRCSTPSAAFGLGFIGILLLHSLVEYPLDYFFFLLPFGFVIGRLERSHSSSPDSDSGIRMPRTGLLIFSIACAMTTLLLARSYPRHELLHAQMQQHHAMDGAVWLGEPVSTPEGWLDQLQVLPYLMSRNDLDDSVKVDAQLWQQASLRYGYAPVLLNYAIGLQRQGKKNEASRLMNRLCLTHHQAHCQWARLSFEK